MARFTSTASRPGTPTTTKSYLHVTIDAADHPDGGHRQGIATLTIDWGSYGPEPSFTPQELGREEFTRFGSGVEEAIEAVRDAALNEQQKGESRRYIETAASRALLEVVKERDFWRRASEVAVGLVNDWDSGAEKMPTTRAEMKEAVQTVTVTPRQMDAVMELMGDRKSVV